MSLMKSRQPVQSRWRKGDLITALEGCELLGYRSAKRLQDETRREKLAEEFASLDCALTNDIWIGGQRRFLRSEIEAFIDAKIEAAEKSKNKRRNNLRLAA